MSDATTFLANILYFTDVFSRKEPDIIPDLQRNDIIFKSSDIELDRVSPVDAWTHQRIVELQLPLSVLNALATGQVIDAFLGKQWIGSTEC